MNKDTVIGIVGAAVLIAAMVGVFLYERSIAETALDEGEAGPAGTSVGPTFKGTATLGQTDTKTVNLTNTTASNVTFHLTWTAINGRDTLKLTVAPPAESGIPEGAIGGPSDTGDITVTIEVPPGANPAGVWEVKVEFVEATPSPLPGGVPPPTPPPNSTDSSVAYNVDTAFS